jgi:SNF2 family DNA or RNA helicase
VQVPQLKNGFTEWEDRPDAAGAVSLLLDDLTIRHSFDEVLSHVPAMEQRLVTFTLSQKTLDAYNALKQDCYLELATGQVSAVNAAVLANKLLQVSSGTVYGTDGEVHLIDTERYELLVQLVEERQHPVVVFYSWKHQRDALKRMFDAHGISCVVIDSTVNDADRTKHVATFQAGEVRVILLHPKTGAHGLTLTAGRTVIWASPRYEADYMKQGMCRIRRGGQTAHTENIMIAAESTIEEMVYQSLDKKMSALDSLLTYLR